VTAKQNKRVPRVRLPKPNEVPDGAEKLVIHTCNSLSSNHFETGTMKDRDGTEIFFECVADAYAEGKSFEVSPTLKLHSHTPIIDDES
jgi:hypothetical protein